MTMYARVDAGIIIETYELPTGFSLEECFHPDVAAQFIECPDDVAQGWTYFESVFSAPEPYVPTIVDQARGAIAAGVHIVSSGTPTVTGVYPIDPATQFKVLSIAAYININDKFPGGMSELSRLDIRGQPHVFSDTSIFLAWAVAVADYIAALDLIIDTGSGTLPTQPVRIE